MTKININNLNFSYGSHQIFTHTCCSFENKAVNVILGLNGSGKTTLIKLITGILLTERNQIYIDDKDIVSMKPYERSKYISYVPQSITEDNDFLVRDYLTFGCVNSIKFYSSPKAVEYKKVEKIAKELELESLLYKKMNELSGGQRQLVAIATAIIQDAKIIIMDEPTSSIDYRYLEKVLKYIDYLRSQDKLIILSCHDPRIPFLLDGNVIVLEEGNIIFQGKAREKLTLDVLKRIYKCDMILSKDLPYLDVSLNPISI